MDREYYRIVEVKNGKIYSLFHGTNGSRQLPIETWIDADVKEVTDGSHSKPYVSGFHLLPSLESALLFFKKKFKIRKNRSIIKCYAQNVRNKKDSNVLLADSIYIPKGFYYDLED